MDFDGFNGIILQQFITALGHHDRVQHDVAGVVLFEGFADRRDQLSRVKHPDFNGVGAHIAEHRVYLLHGKIRWNGMDAGYAPGILGGQGRYDRHAVTANGGKGFQIGLNAGAAAAVGAGDGQDFTIMPGGFLIRSFIHFLWP